MASTEGQQPDCVLLIGQHVLFTGQGEFPGQTSPLPALGFAFAAANFKNLVVSTKG